MAEAKVSKCDVCGMFEQQARVDRAGKLVGIVTLSRVRVEVGDRRFNGQLCDLDVGAVGELLETLPHPRPKTRRRSLAHRMVADVSEIPTG